MAVPKILNLDELETAETDIAIKHEGVEYKMRVLDVDTFISQQKRQAEHERKVLAGEVEEDGVTGAVEIIRDSVLQFFPDLPVGGLPTTKLFQIFTWLNELSATINKVASDDVVDETEGEPGNEAAA